MSKRCSIGAETKLANILKNNALDPRFYPEQGAVASPSPDGLFSAQFAVLKEKEKVEKANE
jgi:hypothetical protein